MNSKETTVKCFVCSECGRAYTDAKYADYCCSQGVCKTCGRDDLPHGWLECGECREKRLWGNAKNRIDLRDYKGEYIYYNERYFNDEYELRDYIYYETMDGDDEPDSVPFPEYGVYGVLEVEVGLDAGRIVDDLYEHEYMPEDGIDWDKSELDEIEDFVAKWNADHAHKVYIDDPDTAIVFDNPDW